MRSSKNCISRWKCVLCVQQLCNSKKQHNSCELLAAARLPKWIVGGGKSYANCAILQGGSAAEPKSRCNCAPRNVSCSWGQTETVRCIVWRVMVKNQKARFKKYWQKIKNFRIFLFKIYFFLVPGNPKNFLGIFFFFLSEINFLIFVHSLYKLTTQCTSAWGAILKDSTLFQPQAQNFDMCNKIYHWKFLLNKIRLK